MRSKKSSKKLKKDRKKRVSTILFVTRRYLNTAVFLSKLLVAGLLLSGLIYLILFSSIFKIQKVFIKGTKDFVNPNDVELITVNNAQGENIFRFDDQKLTKKLEDNLLGAKAYTVRKIYPDTLQVTVHERVPIAMIYKNNEEYFLVDDDGYVLGYTDPQKKDLPKIRYEKEIKIGLFIDKNVVPLYIEFTSLFKEKDVKVSSVSFMPKHVLLYVENGTQVLIGNDKNKKEAMEVVSSLLQEADLEDKELERIDLRYDKVIVLFE